VDRGTGAQEKVESEGLEYRTVFGLEELGLD
jgi:orotate phosphoribosyltransferase